MPIDDLELRVEGIKGITRMFDLCVQYYPSTVTGDSKTLPTDKLSTSLSFFSVSLLLPTDDGQKCSDRCTSFRFHFLLTCLEGECQAVLGKYSESATRRECR